MKKLTKAQLKQRDELISLLESAKAEVEEKYEEFTSRHNRLKGLLSWRIDTEFKSRLRQAQKGAQQLRAQIDETARLDSALRKAQQEAPLLFKSYQAKIDDTKARINRYLDEAGELRALLENELTQVIIDKLNERKQIVAEQLTKARFAVAQIYDLSVTSSSK